MKAKSTAPAAGAQPLISVIVPVYNVEPYLRRCMESICGQSYRHLEIICVDDGSTDDSLAILREYEARDARVRVLTQPNSRQAAARNAALDVARGEWVIGVDSDDYVLPDAYQKAVDHVSDEVDMVCFGVRVEAEPGSGLEGCVEDVHRFANSRYVGVHRLDARCVTRMSWLVYHKLYRRSVIEAHGLRFDAANCGSEDLCFHLRFCAYAGKACFFPDELYVYALRPGSTCYSDSQAALRVSSYVRCLENVLGAFREARGLRASARVVRHVLSVVMKDAAPWGLRSGQPLACRRELLAVAERFGLSELPAVAGLLRGWAAELQGAEAALRLLEQAAAAVEPRGGARALPEGCAHAALPVDAAQAEAALGLLEGLCVAQAGAGAPLCVHVLGVGLSAEQEGRLLACSSTHLVVQLHALPAALLADLPPLAAAWGRLGYVRMALPLLLPSLRRVWLLAPTLRVEGALAPLDEVCVPAGALFAAPASALLPEGQVGSLALLQVELEALREQGGVEAWLAASFFCPPEVQDAELEGFNRAFVRRVAPLVVEAAVPAHSELPAPPPTPGFVWLGAPLPLLAGRFPGLFWRELGSRLLSAFSSRSARHARFMAFLQAQKR